MPDRAWTDKREYKQLSQELRALSRDAFAQRALELLRIRWPECIEAPRLRSVDRAGVDLFVWKEGKPLSLAVQCKGFEVMEERLGAKQIAQCLTSVAKFRQSTLDVERYYLIYNRDGRDETFRTTVDAEVKKLETSGRVETAETWNVQRLLREVFNGMMQRVTTALGRRSVRDLITLPPVPGGAVTHVPLQTAKLVIDRHHLAHEGSVTTTVDDPADLLLNSDAPLTLLLGKAGYGKRDAPRNH